MIQPLEERKNPGEYVNRVKRVEHDHAPRSRDFAYEIGEISDEQGHGRRHSQEFGEDTYEHSEEQKESSNVVPVSETNPRPKPPEPDEGSLDITI